MIEATRGLLRHETVVDMGRDSCDSAMITQWQRSFATAELDHLTPGPAPTGAQFARTLPRTHQDRCTTSKATAIIFPPLPQHDSRGPLNNPS